MRPTTNFTLHAISATSLVALAASSTAAQSPPTLRIVTETPMAPMGDHIEVLSYSWGQPQAAGRRTYPPVTFKSRVGDGPSASGGGANEMSMEDTAGKERSGAESRAGTVGANQSVTVGAAQTQSSPQATGKRQHMPLRTRQYYDQPLQKGSVWIRVSSPWTACKVGARYPSLELGDGAKRYLLQDVTVSSCGDDPHPEEIGFAYKAIKFDD